MDEWGLVSTSVQLNLLKSIMSRGARRRNRSSLALSEVSRHPSGAFRPAPGQVKRSTGDSRFDEKRNGPGSPSRFRGRRVSGRQSFSLHHPARGGSGAAGVRLRVRELSRKNHRPRAWSPYPLRLSSRIRARPSLPCFSATLSKTSLRGPALVSRPDGYEDYLTGGRSRPSQAATAAVSFANTCARFWRPGRPLHADPSFLPTSNQFGPVKL